MTTTHSMASTPSAIISPALAATMWMPGEIQGRCSGDVGEIWARHGGEMGEILGRYGGDVRDDVHAEHAVRLLVREELDHAVRLG